MMLAKGDHLGPYEILEPTGSGGMGDVYRARDTRLDRIVAVKIAKAAFSERFEREAHAVAALNHPNICQLYDVGPDYLVMEFVEGAPIAPPDTLKKLLDLAVQIADGLAAAHAAGLIHRDLKPDNIMVTREGRVKILDFGIAKQTAPVDAAATRTRGVTGPGIALGTVNYMSPEQARGEASLTPQSDQFSFGLVLYELAAGEQAFRRGSAAETMTAIIREEPAPLPASMPAPLRWIIERLLAKDPADRYDSTRDLFRELKHIRERLSEATSAALPAAPVAGPKPGRLVPMLATAAVALVAGAALTLGLLPAPRPDVSQFKFSPLSRQDAAERSPEWSPDSRSIAFTTNVNGVDQVFTKSIESQDAAQLTHSMTRCETPFWSPEGSLVYYRSSNGLWSLPATGGAPELVLPNVQAATMHRDGKTVIFIRDGKLWIDALRELHPREFGASPFPNADLQLVRFSPDGSKVIAAVGNDGWILSYPTGAARKLPLPAHASFESANWFPDSRHMLASQLSTAITGTTLFVIDTQDGSVEPFYQTTGWISEGSVSPDGKRIAYQTGQVEWNVLEISLATRAVRTMMGGSGVISWWPDWAPGGTHYLVSTNRSGASSIEDVSIAEGFSRRLVIPEPGEAAISARWAPDASRIAYSSASSTGNVLMLANTSGGRRTPVGVSLEGEPMFSWSPDGQWIAYWKFEAGKPRLAKIKPGATAMEVVLKEWGAGEMGFWVDHPAPEWSPAGDWILHPVKDGLALTSPDDKTTRPLTSRKMQAYGFSKDGKRVFGIVRNTSGEGAQWQLYSVDVPTGADTLLGPVDLPASTDSIAGLRVHPDGTRFLTSIAKWPYDIWMLEGFDQPRSWKAWLLRTR